MLNATRRKQLLLAFAILAASAVVGVAAYRVREAVLFARLSEPEKKVIGVWTWTTIDAVGRMRIRPSHRFDMWFVESKSDEDHPASRHVTHGSWRIEGDEFVYTYDPGQLGGFLAAEEHRGPVADFSGSMKRVR